MTASVFDLDAYISRSRALDLAAIPWDQVPKHPLSQETVRALRYMQDIESHTIIYLRALLDTRAIDDPEVATFLACWLYEETFHGIALARFVRSGQIDITLAAWKLTRAQGTIALEPPDVLPLQNPTVTIGYTPEGGITAELATDFNAPIERYTGPGRFVLGYARGRGLYASVSFPLNLPGFEQATVAGELDQAGVRIHASLRPAGLAFIKRGEAKDFE